MKHLFEDVFKGAMKLAKKPKPKQKKPHQNKTKQTLIQSKQAGRKENKLNFG